ncbi:MAG: rod shape-determining protein [Oscillospiraceae bacterium]
MASLDIGIDLGTSSIVAGSRKKGVLINEPSVVALDRRTGKVLFIGRKVYEMMGREPRNIEIVSPLEQGVISNYRLTGELVRYLLRQVGRHHMLKPRVIACVPSGVTGVEAQSVIDATMDAGARSVILMEEPLAAAIGAGLNIAKAVGNLVVDIGGGTTDVAVLSMNGIVSKSSVRIAGGAFDEAILRHLRLDHNMLVGPRTAEDIKKELGNVWRSAPEKEMEIKGRGIVTGLPTKINLLRSELYVPLLEVAQQIASCVQQALERVPPELAGDIRTNGLLLTGGGAMIGGLDSYLEEVLRVPARLADDPTQCVAKGTIMAFDYIGTDFDGFILPGTALH